MSTRYLILAWVFVMAAAGSAQAQFSQGDMNCDTAVDGRDVAPFVLALLDPAGYTAAYPGCALAQADVNCDLAVDTGDIPYFVGCLLVGGCSPCNMVSVPGGEFQMGTPSGEGWNNERPVHAVYLSPYTIDRYEVTNQQYVDGLNWAWDQGGLIEVAIGAGQVVRKAGGTERYCATTFGLPTSSRIIWNGSGGPLLPFGVTPGKEDHPMETVSWYGAAAYCNWRSANEGKPLCYDLATWTCNFGVAGYRLPTEAEWEMAAAWDPVQQRHFRFGEHTDGCGTYCLDGQRANYGSSGDPFETETNKTTPVGYYDGSNHGGYQTQDAQSYYGCYDMSGNESEHCNDWYEYGYYGSSPYANPQGPAGGTQRVGRGGSWGSNPQFIRSAARSGRAPSSLGKGFRCALGIP